LFIASYLQTRSAAMRRKPGSQPPSIDVTGTRKYGSEEKMMLLFVTKQKQGSNV
jgi:hypothetical protein